MNLTVNQMLALQEWSEKRRPVTMIEDITKLIIEEAKSRDRSPIHLALKEVMRSVNRIMISKIADVERLSLMEISEEEKEKVLILILQGD